jgi:peptide/nickel transport system permease protein
MKLLQTFILPRLLQWVIVVFVGVTLAFFIPRLSPVNPIDNALGRLTAFQNMSPEGVLAVRETLEDLYGLEGSLLQQYFGFWRRVFTFDLGPSFIAFPTPVTQMIAKSIGWTVGLLGISIILSWIIGLVLGSLAGYFPDRWWSRLAENILVGIYPVPYYILAFVLLMLLTYYWPVFPLVGGSKGTPGFTWAYISSLLYYGFLPALSLVIGGLAFRFIISKALTSAERSSDYIRFAEMAAVPKRKIIWSYLIRNTLLPQVTDLGLSLGLIFEGALITEAVYGYPGLGTLLFQAINAADFNVIMGITLLSILGIATASLIIDLSYPLLDPRVRYS